MDKNFILIIIYMVRIEDLTLGYNKVGYIRLYKEQNYILQYFIWLE